MSHITFKTDGSNLIHSHVLYLYLRKGSYMSFPRKTKLNSTVTVTPSNSAKTLTQQCFLLDIQKNQRDTTPSSSSQTYLLAGHLMQ